jgi:hypothetical protein
MPETNIHSHNPCYTDIIKLDYPTPGPSFNYNWNLESQRWEPAVGVTIDNVNIDSLDIDFSDTNQILSLISDQVSGLSGVIGNLNLSGLSSTSTAISGSIQDQETHRLLSGLSGQFDSINDQETHRLLSGVSGQLSNLSISTDSYRLSTKTVNLKIEEDFILLENIPDQDRFGNVTGNTYGIDRFVMNDIFNTHYQNGRTNPSTPETGHVNYFLHSESTDPDRSTDSIHTFHSDTLHSMRFENDSASSINSYELKDFTSLYESGLAQSILLINESSYPIKFHTIDEDFKKHQLDDPENTNLITLYGGSSVEIDSDEAQKIYIKRPHTISGFMMKYTITYREKINK